MDHEAKTEVAARLAKQLSKSYGNAILAVLLDGSVARGDDTEYSDIELRVVTRRRLRIGSMSENGYAEAVYRDLAIQLQFLEEKEVHRLIRYPTIEWPLKVWPFLEPTFVAQSREAEQVAKRFLRTYRNVRPGSFRPALRWSLVWVWEMYGKVRSMVERGSPDIVWVAPALAHNAALFVALTNRRYLHFGDSRYISEIESFPRLPDGFVRLFNELRTCDSSSMGQAAKEMWESCSSFAREEGCPSLASETWSGFIRTIGL